MLERKAVVAAMLVAAAQLHGEALADVRVVQLYSSPDGEYQAVLLEDDANDTVDRFGGAQIVMQGSHGASRSLLLHARSASHRPVIVDGKRRMLVATRLLARWYDAQAELPDAFLEVDGGAIALNGAPAQRYASLRAGAIAFDAASSMPAVSNFELARHPASSTDAPAAADAGYFSKPAPASIVREYYDAARDRYVLASSQREKAALDFGEHAGWQRTGRSFRALDADPVHGIVSVPVCRYYFPAPLGELHFFSASADECDAVGRQWPGAVLESAEAFRVALPEPSSGLCIPSIIDDTGHAVGSVPVYRAWHRQAGHRYTTVLDEQRAMTARGWIAEGYGLDGTVMCIDAHDPGTIPVPKQIPKRPDPDDTR